MHPKDRVLADLANLEADMKEELGREATSPEILTRLTLFFGVCVGLIASRSNEPNRIISHAATQSEICAVETLHELSR